MSRSADVADSDNGNAAKGASARERALRFNRGMIGLGLVALLAMIFLPL
jgi:hypothetical protein